MGQRLYDVLLLSLGQRIRRGLEHHPFWKSLHMHVKTLRTRQGREHTTFHNPRPNLTWCSTTPGALICVAALQPLNNVESSPLIRERKLVRVESPDAASPCAGRECPPVHPSRARRQRPATAAASLLLGRWRELQTPSPAGRYFRFDHWSHF